MTDETNDMISRAAKRVRDAIDAIPVVPADSKSALHDLAVRAQETVEAVVASDAVQNLADRAERVVRDVTDRAETVVGDVTDRAEDLVHDVTERAESAVETAALVGMEAVDALQLRYRRRVRIVGTVGAGVIVALVVALVSARRR